MPRKYVKKADRARAEAQSNHVVRRWTSSPVIYGWDSRERKDNPDFHPPIGLTSDGRFVDDRLVEIPADKVPAYVREEAKNADRNIVFRAPRKQEGTLRDAMKQSGAEDPTGLDLNAR